MRPTFKILTLVLFLVGFFSLAYSQAPVEKHSTYAEANLNLKSCEIRGNYVVINYEIPYSGMVEIRLFNEDGDKIWQNQYADKWGENTIVLRRSKFHPGKTYAYILNYKKDEIRDQMVIPPTGFE